MQTTGDKNIYMQFNKQNRRAEGDSHHRMSPDHPKQSTFWISALLFREARRQQWPHGATLQEQMCVCGGGGGGGTIWREDFLRTTTFIQTTGLTTWGRIILEYTVHTRVHRRRKNPKIVGAWLPFILQPLNVLDAHEFSSTDFAVRDEVKISRNRDSGPPHTCTHA